MDCFGTYFTHVQTCNVTRVHSATEWIASVHTLTHVQTCTVTRVHSAAEWIAPVHSLAHDDVDENMISTIVAGDSKATFLF